ncbi:MAG TPA: hypothetical protein VKY34_01385 [Xanthomarina sp.]|nr:hypothetical protein [Xanthomarina sp.]
MLSAVWLQNNPKANLREIRTFLVLSLNDLQKQAPKDRFPLSGHKKANPNKKVCFFSMEPDALFLNYFKGPRPDIMLYKITITAMTNKIWIKLPVAMPGTMPKKPNSQITIHMTATSQSKLLII